MTQDDSYILALKNADKSKSDFLKFLKLMDEEDAIEFAETWDIEDIKDFWKQWDGDLDSLGHQVILFDCEKLGVW